MSKKSLTLLEIIISITILALVVAGMANVFVAGKRWFLHSRSRMSGGELGKLFLDPLQMDVRQDQWSSGNCLSRDGVNPADCNTTPWKDPSSNITYTPTYTIDPVAVAADSYLRRVVLKLSWNEPSNY